eukprot:7276781-Pyramimonas_sp.AAC.1
MVAAGGTPVWATWKLAAARRARRARARKAAGGAVRNAVDTATQLEARLELAESTISAVVDDSTLAYRVDDVFVRRCST